jgi:hypothetical protein
MQPVLSEQEEERRRRERRGKEKKGEFQEVARVPKKAQNGLKRACSAALSATNAGLFRLLSGSTA